MPSRLNPVMGKTPGVGSLAVVSATGVLGASTETAGVARTVAGVPTGAGEVRM